MDTDTMYKLLGKLDLMDFSVDPTMSFVKFCTFTENMFEANSLKKTIAHQCYKHSYKLSQTKGINTEKQWKSAQQQNYTAMIYFNKS